MSAVARLNELITAMAETESVALDTCDILADRGVSRDHQYLARTHAITLTETIAVLRAIRDLAEAEARSDG